MATQSTTSPIPPSPPETTAPETVNPAEGENKNPQNSSEEFIKSISVPSEQPMREEQVQNAVKFLSHPKVRGSPVVYRRSFLEKKGLTREEIDEAFRRVPDPPSTGEAVQPAQGGPEKSSTVLLSQVPSQAVQTAAAPSNTVSQPPALQSKLQWPHIVLAVGVIATSSVGTAVLFKNAVIPRLKAWIRRVVREGEEDTEKREKPGMNAAVEAAEAAKAAASTAAVVAKACEDLLSSRGEEKKYFETFAGLLDTQVKEMKSMRSAIRGLESAREARKGEIQYVSGNGTLNNNRSYPIGDQSDSRVSSVSPQGWKVNGSEDSSVSPSSAPASVESSEIPYPKSFMEIMSMVQRGEKPPGIKEINDMPPNPNQQPSNPRLVPRTKPWESSAQAQPEEDRQSSQVNGNSFEWAKQEESRVSSYGIGSKNWPGRDWVPPQTPSVAIPEAAAAIRKPKPKQPPPATTTTTELSAVPPPAQSEDNESPDDVNFDTTYLSEITEEVNTA